MKTVFRSWPVSAIFLLLFGTVLIAIGFYFAIVRPPLLPEDLRYIGTTQQTLETEVPRLTIWLAQVFRVMGSYVAATGVLLVTIAATAFRTHHSGAAAGALISGFASIGWMTIVNFTINSDFKWVLLGVASLWACSMVLFWFEAARPRNG